MKNIFPTICILIASIFLTSCNTESGPKEAADKFLTAMAHMDYETAKKYGTAETQATVDLFSEFSSMYADSIRSEAKKISINIKEVTEEGDKAMVTYNSSDDPAEKVINMVKENGEWKAQFNKENPDNAIAPPTAEPATDPADDTMSAENTEEIIDTALAD